MRFRNKSKSFALQLTLANKHHHLYFRVHKVFGMEIRHLLKRLEACLRCAAH